MLFNRKEVLVLSITFLFLIVSAVSCPKLTGGGKGEEEGVFTGTKGLTASFIPGMPPENVWKDVSFDIGVEVQNQGRLDVSNGGVCVKSFTTQTFGKGDQCSSLGLIHGKEEFSEGEVKQFISNGFVPQEELTRDITYPITAQVCYIGEVVANPNICIRSVDPLIESRCEVKDISLSGGQGGPVAVTKVHQDIIPGETQNELLFTINVKNVGGGRVVDQERMNADCTGLDKISERGIVRVEVSLPGYGSARCQGEEGKLRLTSSGEGEIMCKGIMVPSDVSFPLPLNIGLTFGYVSSFPGGFTIKKTAKGFD
jgi:hypothetical protein